jgi:hypothetical protein
MNSSRFAPRFVGWWCRKLGVILEKRGPFRISEGRELSTRVREGRIFFVTPSAGRKATSEATTFFKNRDSKSA